MFRAGWFGALFRGLSGLLLAAACGCASNKPYQYGRFHPDHPEGVNVQPVVVEYGKPSKTLDRIGKVVGFPAKILPFNSKINNHEVSPETLEKLRVYMAKNDITDVYIAVNQYAPKDQWRRLRENGRIAPFWKYTAGTLSWVGYALFPPRVWGGDRYNPFTNSLYVNSDVPAVVLAEAAYAKDIHGRKFPGTYAVVVNDMPVLTLWRQSLAVSDVLSYARVENDWDVEKQTYHVMYPKMGEKTLGDASMVVTGPIGSISAIFVGPIFGAGGALAGHAVGRSVAKRREAELKELEPVPPTKPTATNNAIQLAGYEEDAPPVRPARGAKTPLGSRTVQTVDEEP